MNNIVRVNVVKIGNSRGICIPKLVLEQVGLSGEVEMEVAADHLVLRRVRRPREGWEEHFQQIAQEGEDKLLDAEHLTPTQWDQTEWESMPAVRRFDVYPVPLDPTVGSEMQKTRPCLVISPDEANRHLATVIVAPMTSQGRPHPTCVACRFDEKDGLIVLDQMRTVDKTRLIRRLGRVMESEQNMVLTSLAEMFME